MDPLGLRLLLPLAWLLAAVLFGLAWVGDCWRGRPRARCETFF